MQKKLLLWVVTFFLAIVPFFWLKPGEMDLGGDASRLYFYDPLNYLKSFPLYGIAPNGTNTETIGLFLVPYVLLIYVFKKIFFSSYLVITIFNSITLVTAFLSIYGIVTNFFSRELSGKNKKIVSYVGIITGLFYILSPILIRTGWDKALAIHNQVFLNPLIFYLLLMYIEKKKKIFIFAVLLITFFFSPNFFPSPYFFSFYLFALPYLIIYSIFIKRYKLNFKEIGVFILLFFGLHLFHLIPLVKNLFLKGTILYNSTFTSSGSIDTGLNYFMAIAGPTKFVNNLLGLPQGEGFLVPFDSLIIVFPAIILIGLILQKNIKDSGREERLNLLCLVFFFLIIMFFISAKVTFIGMELYKSFFHIPGFSMFRNYVGQFSHVYVFFYALTLGIPLYYVLSNLKKVISEKTLFIFLILTIGIFSIPFIKGDMINHIVNKGSKHELKVPIIMDPDYEKLLSYVRENPINGNYLTFPIDDYGLETLSGINGGIYQGPPLIAYLAQNNQFSISGSQFGELLMSKFRTKDYEQIKELLALLNIRYIFYNSDPRIYDDTFPAFPYTYTRKSMPFTQELYQDFITVLNLEKVKNFGKHYHLYQLKNKDYLPHIYVAKNIYYTDDQSPKAFVRPFSFKGDKRIVVYNNLITTENNLGGVNAMFLKAEKVNELLHYYSQKPDSLAVSDTIQAQLYVLLHPFVGLPDKMVNQDQTNLVKIYFDKGVLDAQKKLNKLIDINSPRSSKSTITGSAKNKNLKTSEIDNSWNNILLEYKQTINKHITEIKNQQIPLYSPNVNLVKLRNVILDDENRINTLVKEAVLSENQKNKLYTLVGATFEELQHNIATKSSMLVTTLYNLKLSQMGSYDIYLEKRGSSFLKDPATTISFNSQTLKPLETQEEPHWTYYGDISLDNPKTLNISVTKPEDSVFIEEKIRKAVFDKEHASYTLNLKSEGIMRNYIYEVIQYFSDWEPNTTYLVTFDFHHKNNSQTNTLLVGQNNIDNKLWITYKAVVETNNDRKIALLLILNDQNDPTEKIDPFVQSSEVEMKNIFITAMEYPEVLLVKRNKNTDIKVPSISFKKINPTKYEVNVSGAIKPYTLVFLSGFSPNWKVFLPESSLKGTSIIDRMLLFFGELLSTLISIFTTSSNKEKIVDSYFDNQVREEKRENTFLNQKTFETWGYSSIANTQHFEVNGYANAWVIDPKEIGGKTDYKLILELTSQRIVYPLLFISFTTLGICTILLVLTLKKLFPKSQKKSFKK